MNQEQVVVIGGGLAGLSCAVALADRGEHLQLAIPARTYDGIAGMVRSAVAGKRGVSAAPE